MTIQTRLQRINEHRRKSYEDYKAGKLSWEEHLSFVQDCDEIEEQLTNQGEDNYMER